MGPGIAVLGPALSARFLPRADPSPILFFVCPAGNRLKPAFALRLCTANCTAVSTPMINISRIAIAAPVPLSLLMNASR